MCARRKPLALASEMPLAEEVVLIAVVRGILNQQCYEHRSLIIPLFTTAAT